MPAPTDVATVRMRAYLSLPLPERCKELAVLIEESSTTELQNVFPLLIDSIFGVTNNIGWGLHSINLRKHQHEYEILSHFLGPTGAIFSLCYKLLPDCYLKYDFPVSYLPMKIQVMLEEGIIPPFYSDKLKEDHGNRMLSALSMNPFEYYIFHFAYHLTNPWLQVQQQDNVWINWETVYVQLAHSYLYHFLPRDNSPVLPIIGPYIKKTPPRKIVQSSESKRLQTPRLLRSMMLSGTSPTGSGGSGVSGQHCLPQVWRSETIVQVFLDFWLEYTEEDKIPQSLNSTLTPSLPRRHSIHSGEHIRLVRAFIKTLHEFANSTSGDRSAMDELKRIILPSVQGKIYTFLRKAIHHWPLDSSFRLILEAWLSFIQPWRYIPSLPYTKEGKFEDEERGKIGDPDRWMSFVAHNLLAYTSIFQQLLPRFMRTDLVAPKNALMLFRVTKVFSQPHLAHMIAEAESYMDDANLSRGTKISTNQWSAVARQQILELEGPTYQYVPIFSENIISQIVWFLSIIKQAHLTATSIVEALEKRNTEKNYFKILREFFNGEENSTDDIGLVERKRVPGFLAVSQQQIIEIFQIKVEDIPQVAIVADQEYHDSILSDSFCCQSQCEGACVDGRRPGVFVPIQDERQHCRYIEYLGDPELQPVRSHEWGVLVRWLYRICQVINSKYERQITKFYNQNDFVGRVMKKIIQPPTTVKQLPKRMNGGFTIGSEIQIPPRVSLRVLANYNFMTAIFICIILLRLIGYSTPVALFIVSCCWFLYIVIGAICEPWTRTNVNRFTSNATAFSIN